MLNFKPVVMLKVCFFCAILFSFCNLSGQDFDFYKENITMEIGEGYFHVNGIYYLKNKRSEVKTLVYPFPVDPLYGKVDSVYIFNLKTNEIIEPLKTDVNSAVFKIDFSTHNELAVQVSYRQELINSRAEYILESTIAWKKPLDQANYQLIVPNSIELIKFSIPPGDSSVYDDERIYFWEESNYMPPGNLVFDFY